MLMCVKYHNFPKGAYDPVLLLKALTLVKSQNTSNEPKFMPLRRRKPYKKLPLCVQHLVPLPLLKTSESGN